MPFIFNVYFNINNPCQPGSSPHARGYVTNMGNQDRPPTAGFRSEPKDKRPVVIVQRDSINRSKFQTVLAVPLTRQTKHASIPGNILLSKGDANLPGKSLARCTHVMVIDKSRLIEKTGTFPKKKTQAIINQIIWVLGQARVPVRKTGSFYKPSANPPCPPSGRRPNKRYVILCEVN